MNRETLLMLGLLLYGALYVAGVFVAGLVGGHRVAVLAAVVCAGITYLSYAGQLADPVAGTAGKVLVALSILTGIIAGLLLLAGV